MFICLPCNENINLGKKKLAIGSYRHIHVYPLPSALYMYMYVHVHINLNINPRLYSSSKMQTHVPALHVCMCMYYQLQYIISFITQVYNHVERNDNWLIIFKLHPSVITPDNLHTNILISSLMDSPLDSLYHSLQKVFMPILVKEGQLSETVDPKIQDLVTQLEAGLGTVMRQQGRGEGVASLKNKGNEMLGILTIMDEYQFWVESAETSNSLQAKERAQYFQEVFQPLATQFRNLDSLSLDEAIDLVDTTQDQLDDIWKQVEHDPAYPEQRMTYVLEMISGNFTRFIQHHLKELRFWEGQFKMVHSSLHESLILCDKWAGAAGDLTTKFWKQYTAHPWKGGPFKSEILNHMIQRIEEVHV